MNEEKKNKKKLVLIIGGTILVFILILILIVIFLLFPVSKSNEAVNINIKKGTSKVETVEILKNANLIKSKYAALLYILLTGNKNIQAGSYEFSRDMSTNDIIKSLNKGDIVNSKKPTVKITFKEGITLKNYIELLSENTNLEVDELTKLLNDKDYLKKLINDYWFLENDILDDDLYYSLEGYLFPNTYEFYRETSADKVIRKMLDETSKRLFSYQDEIKKSKLSVHEILSIASICEKEANNYDERTKVAQVIFKRIDLNMNLGMDVTSFYGVKKELTDQITSADLNNNNPYNTRLTTFKGLPAGPICNPSESSIKAALNPADTDYIYFYAESNGTVHFTNSYEEFLNFKILYG